MVTAIYGTDTYGAVRKVGTTPIVTRFAMLQFIPLIPLESYYLARHGKERYSGVPLIFSETSRSIHGLKLARVNRLSVLVAYIRAIGGTLFLFGFTGAFVMFLISFQIEPNPNDEFQRYIVPVSVAIADLGALIAGPTYLATYMVPEREKRIREACAESLGFAADPACCDQETAEKLLNLAKRALAECGTTTPSELLRTPRLALPEQARAMVILCRAALALKGDPHKLEHVVDELLLLLGK